MNYLFDTSALLTHLRQEAGWETVQALLEDSANGCLLASVSLPEFARRLRTLGVPDAEIPLLITDYVRSSPKLWPLTRRWRSSPLKSVFEHPPASR